MQDDYQGLNVAVGRGWRYGAQMLECRQPWSVGALHTPAAAELGATQAPWKVLAGSSRSPGTSLICVRPRDGHERGVLPAGLSGAVYTSLYVGFLQPDTLGLLLFIAIVPTVVVLIAACFVNHVAIRTGQGGCDPYR